MSGIKNPQHKRQLLIERDGEECWLCGRKLDFEDDPNGDWYPSLDHIEFAYEGGSNSIENLRLAHRRCNSDRHPEKFAREHRIRVKTKRDRPRNPDITVGPEIRFIGLVAQRDFGVFG